MLSMSSWIQLSIVISMSQLVCNKHFFHCINTGYDDDILDIGKRKRF